MWINTVVIWILIFFLFAGIIDKATGGRRGYGKAFDEGFQVMGPLALVMVGMISASPLLADALKPVLTPVFVMAGADPSMFPGMLLAIDMGGYSLAFELAGTEEAALFSGVILATLIGPTFVFTVPVALGFISEGHYPFLAKGIMIGLIPVPAGAFLAGLAAGFHPGFILAQLVPVIVFAGLIICGLIWADKFMIRCFVITGKGMMLLVTVIIGITAAQELAGVTVLEGMVPFSESMEIVGLIVLALAGAFPFVHFLKKNIIPLFSRITEKTGISDKAWVGLVSSLAHSIPMFKSLHELDDRGKLVNIAFSVSGAFVLGGHLGFTAALEPDMVLPMMTGKLSAGTMAVLLAVFITRRSVR